MTDLKRKIFAVSDIHGYFAPFKKALDSAGYDRADPQHLLVCLGDLFDRGEESLQILEFFESLERRVILRGNHEDELLKMLTFRKMFPRNFINGTEKTLDSVFGHYHIHEESGNIDFLGNETQVQRLENFILKTENYFETENYLFVHGWFPENLKNSTDEEWINARKTKWISEYSGVAPLENKTVVCGHYPAFFAQSAHISREPKSPLPFYGNGLIAIDSGTHETKAVSVVILEDELCKNVINFSLREKL